MTHVFLTGATGAMGSAGLRELSKYPDKYYVTVLARHSKKNQKFLAPFIKNGVNVVWGDLLDKDAIRRGIGNAEIVLHVGGMVSPEADKFPEKTMSVNIGAMQNICDAIKDIETQDKHRIISLVYIGSVSQYGPHMPPNHWGGVGMPLLPAKYDAYAYSKIEAERIMVSSGIRRWVSLRQTGILHPGLLSKANNPTIFHVPLRGVLEWVTVEDSGRLLEAVCRPEVPDSFWCDFYNIGGGKHFRMSNLEFERGILSAIGCPVPEKIFNPEWFATDNFHGIWYTDSDVLEDILHFRGKETAKEWFEKTSKKLPAYYRLAKIVPAGIIKTFMKNVASSSPMGTLSILKNDDHDKIEAFWGGRVSHSKIKGWKEFQELSLDKDTPESSSLDRMITDIESKENLSNELSEKICQHGHKYLTSPLLSIRGGHSCPYCLRLHCKV